AEEFASGAVAYSLNNGNTDTPVWFQTLGTDACPVLDSSHMIVILNEDGTYSNKKGDAIDKTEMSQQLPAIVNVYDMQGRLVKSNVKAGESLNGLPHGLYIVGGKKMLK
ncbi:MAG: T9SS type A sorting domain-containing protein, partial [Bacteroidaceae bacterium]|nr:T9SS type A sorting domain-containing protein [Bacteroidaceae bacterium]